MRIEIGKVLKPQGIKGELKVLPLSLPQYLCEAENVLINGKPAKITNSVLRDEYAFVTLDICADRNTAETMRDAIITADTENLSGLGESEYFFDDLVGCHVTDENGADLGEIVEVENYGASDIVTIHQGFSNVACPFLGGVFVEVNTRAKKIKVNSARFREVTEYED